MKLGSLFDGIGGWLLAAVRHGITPVWASEIEPFPITVTEKHFPNVKHLGDLTKINGADIEPVDVITFGSPCQDLSVAGKRAGLEGARSGLFMEAVRIINEMRDATNGKYPRFAVWENVPGAFSSNKGDDFRAVLEEITESKIPMPKSGKWATSGMVGGNRVEVAWRVLDAQYWGVPQRRKRIFLVADFGGCSAGEILFKPESLRGDIAESRSTREGITRSLAVGVRESSEVAHCLRAGASKADKHESTTYVVCYDLGEARLRTPGEYIELCPTLSARMGTGGNNVPGVAYAIAGNVIDRKIENGGNGKGVNEEVCFTLNTIDRHAVCYGADLSQKAEGIGFKEELSACIAPGTHPGHGNHVVSVDCRNLNENQEVSGTLQSKSTGGYSLNYQNPVRIGYNVRRLTPIECERLQGLPDDYTAGGSDTQRYKALGNGMAQPCADYVMEGISEILRQ